jgi:hypothetical protein
MRVETPNFIASEELLWLKKDGSEIPVHAQIGTPYQIDDITWACPAFLDGIDGRYADIVGSTSFQALSLAMHVVGIRLRHQVEAGEIFVYPEDRATPWNLHTISAVFG